MVSEALRLESLRFLREFHVEWDLNFYFAKAQFMQTHENGRARKILINFYRPRYFAKRNPKAPVMIKSPKQHHLNIFESSRHRADKATRWIRKKQSHKKAKLIPFVRPLGWALVFTFLLTPTQCLSIIVFHSFYFFSLSGSFAEEKTSNKHRSKWVKT